MYWDTGWVNLNVCRVSKPSTLAVASHGSRNVASHCVGREEEGVSVTAGTYYHCMREETLNASGDEVAGDDTTRTFLAVLISDEDDVEHLVAGIHLHFALADLAAECAVGTEEQLLAGLALGVERTAHLCATEGTVVQETAVFACERNALCDTLVDDGVGHFRQTVYIRLTGTVVSTLDRIVIETIDGVAVVLVVLGCVDTTLSCD